MDLFATIHFERKQLRNVQRLLQMLLYTLPRNTPVYATFEQTGDRVETQGAEPHLHLVILNNQRGNVAVVKRLFDQFDLKIDSITPWRSADLIFRYLRGYKKNSTVEIQRNTRQWRKSNGLNQAYDFKNAAAKARSRLLPESFKSVLSRRELYDS